MQKWEYKTLARWRKIDARGNFPVIGDWDPKDITAALNELGEQGWELVAYAPRLDDSIAWRTWNTAVALNTTELYHLKRPKP